MIAHPERLPDVQQDIKILREVVNRGALLQITARSLLGAADRKTKRCCQQLLEAGMVALVASDAHSTKSVLPSDTQDALQAIVGAEVTQRILVDNPNAVLAGKPVIMDLPAAPPVKKSKFWFVTRALSGSS